MVNNNQIAIDKNKINQIQGLIEDLDFCVLPTTISVAW